MKSSTEKRKYRIIVIGIAAVLLIFTAAIAALKPMRRDSLATDSSEKEHQLYESGKEKSDAADESGKEKSSAAEETSLDVRVGMDEKVMIPDPATAEGKISISLMSKSDVKKLCADTDDDEGLEKSQTMYPNYLADLSFAGFDEPVFVSSYVVGEMTGQSGVLSHITKQTKKGVKEQEVEGSCLGLFVIEEMDPKDVFQDTNVPNVYDCYFVILDYKNGLCYKEPTDFFLHTPSRWVDLSAVDLTGDGEQELVVTYKYGKSMDFGVYHVNTETHSVKEIYSTFRDWEENGEFFDRKEFVGTLEDDYKVTLQFPCIGYSETVSMITDAGYEESRLQEETDEMGCVNFVGLWKDGKLCKERVEEYGSVSLYTLDHIAIAKKEGTMQIEIVRSVYVGHRSETIGHMHIYLEYDKELDSLVLKNAKYVDYKTAKKEWKSKSWGKLEIK